MVSLKGSFWFLYEFVLGVPLRVHRTCLKRFVSSSISVLHGFFPGFIWGPTDPRIRYLNLE